MTRPDVKHTTQSHGEVLTAISDGMVALLKEYYGRGPTRTKSYDEDDLVVCVLRGGFSRVEQTLLEGGRGPAVIQQRMEFQELMRRAFRGGDRARNRPAGYRFHERKPAAPRHDVRGVHPRAHRPRRTARASHGRAARRGLTPTFADVILT